MAEFQTGSPSVRQIQGFIKDKKEVEAKLTTGDVIAGRVAWQDQDCLCFRVSGQDIIVWRASLVYIKLRA